MRRLLDDETMTPGEGFIAVVKPFAPCFVSSGRMGQSGPRRRPETVDLHQVAEAGPQRDPEQTAARDELESIVREQMGNLPDKYRLALMYATIEELDYETIGAMLKVKPGTVKQHRLRSDGHSTSCFGRRRWAQVAPPSPMRLESSCQ
jgi:hypothetical protein